MDFYAMSVDEGRRKKFSFGIVIGETPMRKIQCNKCGMEWNQNLLVTEDAKFDMVLSNDHFPDFLGVMNHILLSTKAKDALLEGGITGYRLKEIKPISSDDLLPEQKTELKKDGYKVQNFSINPPTYFRMFVNEGASVHPDSKVKLVKSCDDCGFKKYTTEGMAYVDPFQPIFIDRATWKGKDLFCVSQYGIRVFCTEKFVEIYNHYKLTGLIFDKVNWI